MKNIASLAILLLCAATLSAQTKQRLAVLPSVGDLDPPRLILLTDKVREIATKNLPMEEFNILKQDAITKLIGEEELYRACKEGVCIGDLARKTNANYGARCDVIRLDTALILKFELYSVNEDAIFETFTDYNVKDFRGMFATLERRLPNAFKKMLTAPKPEPPKPPPPPKPLLPPAPTKTNTAAVSETSFVDKRDGTTYKKTKIGNQTWMAENLNYAAGDSKCYGEGGHVGWDFESDSSFKRTLTDKEIQANCEEYGRLYNWNTAMGACPAGWHLPSEDEWNTLEKFAGGGKKAVKKLKSTTGWKNKKGNGTDEYGFSALPGGYGTSRGRFQGVGKYGFWWSTEEDDNMSYVRGMTYHTISHGGLWGMNSVLINKRELTSVRCVQD